MWQTVVVYIILSVAVGTAVWLLYRSLRRPQDCAKKTGCTNCPLVQHCDKKPE